MKRMDFGIFLGKDPEQVVRLKRFFMAAGTYLVNTAFVLLCWWMNYLSTETVWHYLLLGLTINLGVFVILRSDLNKRFADPSLTFPQITLATFAGLYLMYFAGEARGTFWLLGLAMFIFGMFRFQTRDFVRLAVFELAAYAGLILLLLRFRPHEIHLKTEVLQWMALAVALGQFSFLASYIGHLRRKVREKNQALAKQNTELEIALQRINDMAIRDELTGVYNRRYLMERIAEEASRCVRNGSVFCLCVIDIDLFKRINDTYGHLVGDAVLRAVAKTASGSLRQTDFFGRYGGEEFLMVLLDTPADGAMVTAQRVRQKIEQLVFSEIHEDLHVTISIGITEHIRKEPPAATFRRADEALYRAKETGRNKCVLAPSDRPLPASDNDASGTMVNAALNAGSHQ